MKTCPGCMVNRVARNILGDISPRPPCILCVRKHISQASALLQESLQGYPEHRDLAIGHLAEAEAEAEGLSHDFAARLRQERLKLEREEGYVPDCINLLNISYNIKEMYGAIMTIESRVAKRFYARKTRQIRRDDVQKFEEPWEKIAQEFETLIWFMDKIDFPEEQAANVKKLENKIGEAIDAHDEALKMWSSIKKGNL